MGANYTDPTRRARFDLVTAAHRFLLAGLPFRHPSSRAALDAFLNAALDCRLAPPDRDSVLVQFLAILQRHTGGRLPSLVDRYLLCRREQPDALMRFRECVEGAIQYRGIGNAHVEHATAIVHARYNEANLRQAVVAEAVGLTPGGLCTAFRATIGQTFVEYLRVVRLDHAVALLTRSSCSVKEAWSRVGYGDAANFDHDFKARFGLTPSEYRSRHGQPFVRESTIETRPLTARRGQDRRVLIVDDDETTSETLRTSLTVAGYVAEVRASRREAIDAAMRTRPDVILLDYHLPDMDGLTCLRTLRTRLEEPNQRPLVALFTADWDLEQQSDVVQALGAAYMSKLSDLAEVEQVILSLCEMDTLPADRSR